MEAELRSVPDTMIRVGLGALAHANAHAMYESMDNDCWNELAVTQAAHAAELLIKARIAEEHPLLIFEQLPKNDQLGKMLSFKQLVSDGRTIQYSDLPERLWAATGIKIKDIKQYVEFGKLRNMIQHFAPPPGIDLSQQTLEFIYSVIDPFINECWGLYAINHVEDIDLADNFIPGLVTCEIKFLIPPGADLEKYVDWPENEAYSRTMKKRMAEAKALSYS